MSIFTAKTIFKTPANDCSSISNVDSSSNRRMQLQIIHYKFVLDEWLQWVHPEAECRFYSLFTVLKIISERTWQNEVSTTDFRWICIRSAGCFLDNSNIILEQLVVQTDFFWVKWTYNVVLLCHMSSFFNLTAFSSALLYSLI